MSHFGSRMLHSENSTAAIIHTKRDMHCEALLKRRGWIDTHKRDGMRDGSLTTHHPPPLSGLLQRRSSKYSLTSQYNIRSLSPDQCTPPPTIQARHIVRDINVGTVPDCRIFCVSIFEKNCQRTVRLVINHS